MPTMTTTSTLERARTALHSLATRTAELLRSLETADVPIPASEWTVRDAAAHLVNGVGLYCELVNGVASPIEAPAGDGPALRDAAATVLRQLLADIPERDPFRLAALVVDGAKRLVDTTAGRRDDQVVRWHSGVPMRLGEVMSIMVGEFVLHGYDMAIAAGRPWPVDQEHAALVLSAYAPIFGMCRNPLTASGVNVACELELRGVGRLVARFVDGEYRLEAAGSCSVDCSISADPVAYLLVVSGRLSQWSAISLGLLSAGGSRPELALRFGELFVYP
jgi:uncharacterized protein (TIGR03083 family)